jgi:hypothetical protein
MSTVSDPLEAVQDADRLFYQLGIMLDAQDFRDEQTYHRGRLARAIAFLHGTGTASGLAVRQTPATPANDADGTPAREEEVRVEPGLALDRRGRLIEVPRPACIRLQRWFDAQSSSDLTAAAKGTDVLADVFLRFAACERGRTPSFATGPFDGLDATAPSRIRDGYELRLALRPEAETPPLPTDHNVWPDLSGVAPADRPRQLHDAIRASWAAAQAEDLSVPASLGVSAARSDWVFLARVRFPIDALTPGARPTRNGAAVVDDETGRLFAYSTAALARVAGL